MYCECETLNPVLTFFYEEEVCAVTQRTEWQGNYPSKNDQLIGVCCTSCLKIRTIFI